mmetsp:Transcript_2633/g.8811  ORF Transcript_2633/g.8811 Transcript_2633/m.8811 type:complete len:202 (+) Transcript_2633:2555-3160(+)
MNEWRMNMVGADFVGKVATSPTGCIPPSVCSLLVVTRGGSVLWHRNIEGQTTAITGSLQHCIIGLANGAIQIYDLSSGSLAMPRLILGDKIASLVCSSELECAEKRLVAITTTAILYQWNYDTMHLTLKVSLLPLLRAVSGTSSDIRNSGHRKYVLSDVTVDPIGRVVLTIPVAPTDGKRTCHVFVFDPQMRCWRHLLTPW